MSIQQQTITPVDFDYLQLNITDQAAKFTEAAALAQSGLQRIVDLHEAAPTIDLVGPLASHLNGMESTDSISNFVQVVSAINSHLVARGTILNPGDSNSDRLNRWLAGQEQLIPDGSGGVIPDPSPTPVQVTPEYQAISANAGFTIHDCNVIGYVGPCPPF